MYKDIHAKTKQMRKQLNINLRNIRTKTNINMWNKKSLDNNLTEDRKAITGIILTLKYIALEIYNIFTFPQVKHTFLRDN